MTAPEWNLLEKTEFRIENIALTGANLTEVAAVVADVLGLPRADVVVIDARDELLTLDILRTTLDPYAVAGKQSMLLKALGQLPGINVDERTSVCSEGVLGWLAADSAEAAQALDRSIEMASEITRRIASRAIVFSTGPEVISGQIEDTNKPWISERLRGAEFSVTEGRNLPDDSELIAATIRQAGEEGGYGLIITTGGVGAEGKDGTVEALLSLDPEAATPAVFFVEQGHGRHVKGQVRIGVGTVGTAIVVCLPGPHTEATSGTDALLAALKSSREPARLAAAVADTLRARLRHHHEAH
ncbi:molybdopterin-binding protein [Smaragdicoccus niigatensis]|uniref:molybdopterin-binding protein n=1 Tax=Smaragdicoccus niigatensis TaxID=359359 RepID=UPI0003763551|nr:molybdopterin-binding protein [Smaragdicoccus niigatensis]